MSTFIQTRFFQQFLVISILLSACLNSASAYDFAPFCDLTTNPVEAQIDRLLIKLKSENATDRAGAAESLGYMRAYRAESALIQATADSSPEVRRDAALALAWCGGRKSISRLVELLEDPDWLVRQSAHVSLTNLTAMEFPFTTTASDAVRHEQIERWSTWCKAIEPNKVPEDILVMLDRSIAPNNSSDGRITASTTYKGPPSVLLDGRNGPDYWQTKLVDPPQWVQIDLQKEQKVASVAIQQYSDKFVMTGYDIAVSDDGETFKTVASEKDVVTPVRLVVNFEPCDARYVRITSYGSVNPTYPTTFYEIKVSDKPQPIAPPSMPGAQPPEPEFWRAERAIRALGVFGDQSNVPMIIEKLGAVPSVAKKDREVVRTGLRSLGRLGGDEACEYLISLLENPFWARYAAEALGDLGDRRAITPLLVAYERFSKNLDWKNPQEVPRDDRMTFPSEDRMLETPYLILQTLVRLPWENAADREQLRRLAPRIIANLPGDHDAFMLYQPEVGHRLTRWVLELVGLRQEAFEQAMIQCGQPRRVAPPVSESDKSIELTWSKLTPYRISCWFPCVVAESEDIDRLVALLTYEDGWVSLNAAKALAFLDDRKALKPLVENLEKIPAEADYGYSGTFKDEEYNDPAPRRREGMIRAIGLLGGPEQTDMLAAILEDSRSVLEIRYAAAEALADLKCDKANDALRRASLEHDFLSIRHIARDALLRQGIHVSPPPAPAPPPVSLPHTLAPNGSTSLGMRIVSPEDAAPQSLDQIDRLIFIKGSNDIPNTKGTVEQADRWRQTYVVTDSGPAYRPGRNLYTLSPPRPDGKVTPLTTFKDEYVADLEMSPDGSHVLFCRRGQDNPWWHVWRINIDGSGLEQITDGPFHYVGPIYLPDGRIAVATSRLGIRDEYHAYPCTSLWVMNADGSDQHPIATNIGRDNDPAMLLDGRIAFSRLEVFYSRNKTELTLHAIFPDGTRDAVLYGPERRQFWRNLDHGPRTPADVQEKPLTHRVTRMTQPQPMPDGRNIVCVTQGGLILVGSRRDTEQFITPDYKTRAYTTPYPLPDGTILCAACEKESDRNLVDIGLYLLDPQTGETQLVYNDPTMADFEARPVMARRQPPSRPDTTWRGAYSGQMICTTVFATREPIVQQRGRLVRLIEGVPMVGRHSTQTNRNPVWQNHGGTFTRVLGTIPLAPDGSFNVEVPADRLMHFQVLDSDRRVVNNQLTWIYARPGERKSCIGCHEDPHSTTRANNPLASHFPPAKFFPEGDEFTYRAKAWYKGDLPDEIEERTRTVRSVNLFGR